MYETLKYIKDRFEEENEGPCFSYLGTDEKKKRHPLRMHGTRK